MTAPRTFLDHPVLAKLLGVDVPPSVPHPAPTDTIAVTEALKQRRDKGGAHGGEFTDAEMADYNRAAGNVDNAISAERLAPMIAALKAKAAQKPDATATRRSK